MCKYIYNSVPKSFTKLSRLDQGTKSLALFPLQRVKVSIALWGVRFQYLLLGGRDNTKID